MRCTILPHVSGKVIPQKVRHVVKSPFFSGIWACSGFSPGRGGSAVAPVELQRALPLLTSQRSRVTDFNPLYSPLPASLPAFCTVQPAYPISYHHWIRRGLLYWSLEHHNSLRLVPTWFWLPNQHPKLALIHPKFPPHLPSSDHSSDYLFTIDH